MHRKKIDKTKRERVFKRDGYMCSWCFSPWDLTIDHIIPVSKGGANHMVNLMTLCENCNKKKGRRDGSKIVEVDDKSSIAAVDKRNRIREQRGY